MEIGARSWSHASRSGSLSGRCKTLLEGLLASARRRFGPASASTPPWSDALASLMRTPCPRRCEGKQKPGRDCRPSGRSSINRVCAALFSDLFNVVASRPAKSPRRQQGNIGTGPASSSGGSHTTRLRACFACPSLCLPVPASVSLAAPGKLRLEAIRTAPWLSPFPSPSRAFSKSIPMCRARASLPAGIKPIKLSSNETPLGPSPKAVAAYQGRAGATGALPGWIGDAAARGDRGALWPEPGRASSAAPARTSC